MKYKSIFKPLSPYGVEQQYIENEQEVPEGWTEVWPPQPCWKPVYDWNANKWIETATDEEMHPSDPEEEPTTEEMLAQQVSDLEIKDIEKNDLIEKLGQQVSELEIMILGGNGNE